MTTKVTYFNEAKAKKMTQGEMTKSSFWLLDFIFENTENSSYIPV